LEVTLMATTMSRELAALCTQLVQWRKDGGGGRGKRIPEAVWQQAAAVARVDGIYATARAARLNYERLKASTGASDAARAAAEPVEVLDAGPHRSSRRDNAALARGKKQALAKPRSAQFVSVQMAPVVPRRTMTIELTSHSGDRMRIESTDAIDMAVVVQSFWSKRP
jgi:hypothetical protein